MSQFRAKKLDLGGFVNVRILRDHTKRKVFAQHEQERYGSRSCSLSSANAIVLQASSEIHYTKHLSASPTTFRRTVGTVRYALLYEADANQEQMYNGWGGKKCVSRF